MMRAAWLLLTVPALAGCPGSAAQCYSARWGYYGLGDTHVTVAPTIQTPGGISVDTSGQNIAPALIDRLTREVSECLKVSINPGSFVVKVPGDWGLSCDKSQQVLSASAPEAGCAAKGLTCNAKCSWRAFIQCPNAIVTTPSLYLYKDALVRFVTGSQDPWSDPALAPCVAPTTGPLDDGSGK